MSTKFQGLKAYLLILNPSLLFHCFLGCLPRKPFQIPLIWYIYHLSKSHRRQPYQKSFKSVMVMLGDRVDFTRNDPIYSYFWVNYSIPLQMSPLSNILPVHDKIYFTTRPRPPTQNQGVATPNPSRIDAYDKNIKCFSSKIIYSGN